MTILVSNSPGSWLEQGELKAQNLKELKPEDSDKVSRLRWEFCEIKLRTADGKIVYHWMAHTGETRREAG